MKAKWTLARAQLIFFVVTGLSEGILTALILTAGKIMEQQGTITPGLAIRVGLAAGLPEVVVFFAAEYSRQKGDLARMERQLNLTAHGQLAAGRLGRLAFQESSVAAAVSSACSFAGAATPLMIANALPGPGWLSIVVAISCLSLLGSSIGYSLSGCKSCWALVMAVAGAALAMLGNYAKLV